MRKIKKLSILLVIIPSILICQQKQNPNSFIHPQADKFISKQLYNKLYYNQSNSSLTADSALTKVGQWEWGPCSDVAVQGNYVYIGNGYLFQVLDVSDPANPKIVGQLSMEYPVYRVRVSGNYAYTISPFRIIDISNPANPVVVSTYHLSSGVDPSAEEIKGNYAYLGNALGFVYIIDISDPSNPREIGRMRTFGEIVEYIAVKDTVLYASPNDDAVNIFNIADPSSPFWIPSVIPNGPAPLTIEGNYLYTGTGADGGVFQTYDISDPYNPRLVNGIPVNIDSHYTSGILFTSVSVVDTIAYVTEVVDTIPYISQFNEILVAVDIADTNNIHIISKLNNPYGASDFFIWGFGGGGLNFPYAYYVTNTGLWSANVENPNSMKTASFFSTGWYINNMTVDSSYHAYLAETYGGLKILDFSEPSSPKLIGYYLPKEQVIDVVVSGSYAYLDCDSGLQIIDISNSASPKFISRVLFNDITNNNIEGNFDFLSLDGSTIYAARKSQGLFTVDVSNPNNPQIISTDSLRGIPVGISQSNGYLYVADIDPSWVMPNNTGVELFNISNPSAPVESGFLKITNLVGLTTYKNGLYVVGYDTTARKVALVSYDITNPANPILNYILDNNLSGISTVDIKANEDYAYIVGGNNILITDISNSNSGKNIYLGNADSLGINDFNTFAVSDRIILLGGIGVTTLRNNLITGIITSAPAPDDFELFQNYPNPFNPATTIKYQLPSNGYVTLAIYDILGRNVETLVNSFQNVGNYVAKFDASKFSSGVYFYRLQAGAFVETRKMIVIK